MGNNLPLVSIIVPCRNEEKYIEKCLNSILNQTHPKERLEILVVDGRSEDRTREIIKKEFGEVKLLDNPKKIFPAANNLGIKEAKGEIIAILGCHAIYPRDYIEKCVKYLKKYDADDVGGRLEPLPGENTFIAKAIVLTLGGRFGKGKKEQSKENKPIWTDTVFGGCYKKEIFDKIGLFNENLVGSSDMDFNLRLKKQGGKILLIPETVVYYYPKSKLKDFFWHNIRDGIWAILPIKFLKRPLKFRHCLPFIFVLTLPLSIWLYIPVVFYFSFKIALREKDLRYLFLMPIVFATRHIGYGLGSIWGVVKLVI